LALFSCPGPIVGAWDLVESGAFIAVLVALIAGQSIGAMRGGCVKRVWRPAK